MELLRETQKRINVLLADGGGIVSIPNNIIGILREITGARIVLLLDRDKSNVVRIRIFCADIPIKQQSDLRERLEAMEIPLTESGFGKISESGKDPEIENDPDLESAYRKMIKEVLGGVDTIINVPVKLGDRSVGLVEFYNPDTAVWDEVCDTVMTVCLQMAAIIERFTNETKIRERIGALKQLATINEAITAPYQIEVAIDVLLKSSKRFFQAYGSSMLVRDDEGRTIFVSVAGEQSSVIRGKELVRGEGIVGWVMSGGGPVLIEDVSKDDRFSPRIDAITEIQTGSIICAPLKILNEIVGALEIIRTKGGLPFTQEDLEVLVILSSYASMALYKERNFTRKEKWFKSTINLLSEIIKVKDRLFPENREMIKKYVVLFGLRLDLSPEEMKKLDIAAAVKDIGKIVIPEEILSKKSELTEEEWQKVMGHPLVIVDILKNIDEFKDIIPIIKYHHERYDGSGYPDGLEGDNIPKLARIFSIADAYSAMLTSRPYRKPFTREEAKRIVSEQKGRQFDPALVDEFIKAID
ncbi:MAG: HD domain-containing phosphohydrolase [Elusimicrobiota bacterium]